MAARTAERHPLEPRDEVTQARRWSETVRTGTCTDNAQSFLFNEPGPSRVTDAAWVASKSRAGADGSRPELRLTCKPGEPLRFFPTVRRRAGASMITALMRSDFEHIPARRRFEQPKVGDRVAWAQLGGLWAGWCRRLRTEPPSQLGRLLLGLVLLVLPGCGETTESTAITRQELLDPTACRSCHPVHFEQWSGSMHAYASTDPVFLAMNRRGQEETAGELGDFCVNCHAPMAVREGETTDGLNLDELPEHLQGVTCYFCHNAAEIDGQHNNPITLASSDVMFGGVSDPVANPFHQSSFSELLSGDSPAGAKLCGACHDIVTPAPPAPQSVHLEQTYVEWQDSLFAGGSCSNCHVDITRGEIAVGGPAERTLHSHEFAAVDVALTPFPVTDDREADARVMQRQRELVTEVLDQTLRIDICVQRVSSTASIVEVTLDNVGAGHYFPSGATHDRRVWVELKAYSAEQQDPVYESGVIEANEPLASQPENDTWTLHDKAYGPDGEPAHFFWEIASLERHGIPSAVTNDATNPDFYRTHVTRRFPSLGATPAQIPALLERVTVTVKLRPMGLDILDDLVESGHLDDTVRDAMPTFDLIPNRHLAEDPMLSNLAEVSFEWSDAVKQSSLFGNWITTAKPFPKDCVGLPRN